MIANPSRLVETNHERSLASDGFEPYRLRYNMKRKSDFTGCFPPPRSGPYAGTTETV